MPFMFYGTGYSEYDFLLILALCVIMILGGAAQYGVRASFKKYSKVQASFGMPASRVAAELLNNAGSDAVVTAVGGTLTDHYNPKTNTVGLSRSVYESASVAALAIAAHEIGHVMQYEENYMPIKIRNTLLPVANIGSNMSPLIVILGLLFSSYPLALAGVFLFGAVLMFQLITLPVEFNASSRAIEMLAGKGYITADESMGARKVLRSAALTYVVATLASAVTFIRLLLISQRTRRNR